MSTVQEDFDRIALLSTHEPWTHNRHYHNFLLRQLPAVCENVLEIGCGTGEFSRRLASRSARVMALDLSPEMIRLARSRSSQFSNIDYQVADAMSWTFSKEAFDCVASIATLHHLALPELLSRIKESLKPGGVLLILDLFERERSVLKPEGPIDFVLDLSARPISLGLRLLHEGRVLPSRQVRAAWAAHEKHDSYLTLNQVREICREILPGARIRKHLLWRYSVVWRKV
jgi:ubiquinone/menaquinone biosynthesis C-methylase UbiE